MRALPKKFSTVPEQIRPVRAWLERQRQRIERDVERHRTSDTPVGLIVGGAGWLLVGGLIALLVGGEMVGDRIVDVHWTTFASVWITTAIGALGCGTTWHLFENRRNDQRRNATRVNLQLELVDGNTLAQRAQLILRAAMGFAQHCDRYQQWRHQVDEELLEEDAGAAARYLAFLETSYAVIAAAITNFTVVAERVRREEEYAAQHPELKDADGHVGLTLLLNDLKTVVEPPELPTMIADPVRALAHEEALAEVVADLERTAEMPPTS